MSDNKTFPDINTHRKKLLTAVDISASLESKMADCSEHSSAGVGEPSTKFSTGTWQKRSGHLSEWRGGAEELLAQTQRPGAVTLQAALAFPFPAALFAVFIHTTLTPPLLCLLSPFSLKFLPMLLISGIED